MKAFQTYLDTSLEEKLLHPHSFHPKAPLKNDAFQNVKIFSNFDNFKPFLYKSRLFLWVENPYLTKKKQSLLGEHLLDHLND